jgi:hypothetical protein
MESVSLFSQFDVVFCDKVVVLCVNCNFELIKPWILFFGLKLIKFIIFACIVST